MYIYLDREETKKGFALVLGVSETKTEDYKNHYEGRAIEYIGDDIPHYITYVEASDTIREATETEKLERNQITLDDNQVIIDNQIYTYDKKYQKVVDNKIVNKTLKELFEENLITIDEIRSQKREELKNIRDRKLRDNIFIHDAEFQIRNDIDIENFKDVERAINRGYSKLTDKRNWILADNSIRQFTNEQLLQVLDEKGKRKEKLFNYFGLLSMKLAQATTVEEIEAIKWE